jgi:hypothetical protein
VLICSERKVLLADCIAGGWFVLRKKYCWLVADKPNEQTLLDLNECLWCLIFLVIREDYGQLYVSSHTKVVVILTHSYLF